MENRFDFQEVMKYIQTDNVNIILIMLFQWYYFPHQFRSSRPHFTYIIWLRQDPDCSHSASSVNHYKCLDQAVKSCQTNEETSFSSVGL